MENTLKYLYYCVGIFVGIALIMGILVLLYYLFKVVYLDIKGAEEYKDYYYKYFQKLYERECDKNKKDYETQLTIKSKEYFKEFYDEEMKKKEDQNV